MTDTTPAAHELTGDESPESRDTPPRARLTTPVPRIGVWSWSFVGTIFAAIIVVLALGALSEIVLPMTFAAVLAIVFKPLVGVLERRKIVPTLAAGLIVLGLLLLMAGVVVATVRGVSEQTDQISEVADAAIANAAKQLDVAGVDPAALDDARTAVEGSAPMISGGFVTKTRRRCGQHHRARQRHHPRRADHVLPAEGRQPVPSSGRWHVRAGLAR